MKVYGQFESAQDENLASTSGIPTPWGRRIFNTALKALQFWNGTSWATLRGDVTSGTTAAATAITAGGGITPIAGGSDQLWFVKGSSGAVVVTAVPPIAAGSVVGQKLKLKGTSDTNTLRINQSTGVSQQGDILLGLDSTIQYTWDGTNWSEDSRR